MTKTLCRSAGTSILFAGLLLFSASTQAESTPVTVPKMVPLVKEGDAVAEDTHGSNAGKEHHAHDAAHPAHHSAHAEYRAKHGKEPKYKIVHRTPYGGRWGVRADLLGALALTLKLDFQAAGNDLGKAFKASANFALPVRVSGTYGISDALELFLTLGTAQRLATIANDNVPFGMLYSLGFGFRYYINTDDPVKLFIAPSIHLGYGSGVSAGFEGQSGLQFELIEDLSMAVQAGMIFCPASFSNLNMVQIAPYAGVGFHYHF